MTKPPKWSDDAAVAKWVNYKFAEMEMNTVLEESLQLLELPDVLMSDARKHSDWDWEDRERKSNSHRPRREHEAAGKYDIRPRARRGPHVAVSGYGVE
jgi:hypothetical protein